MNPPNHLPAVPPTPVIEAPAMTGVPLQDITSVLDHVAKLKKRRLNDRNAITDKDLADAAVSELTAVQMYGGGAVAPPWFAPAVQAALQAALIPLQNQITNLQNQITNLQNQVENVEVSVFNSTSTGLDDHIRPKKNARGDIPNNFPSTIGDIDGMTHSALNTLLQFYELPAIAGAGQMEWRAKKRALVKFLGIRS